MAQRPANSTALLLVLLELAGVGLFTVLAGTSDEVSTVMLIIMAGLWLIFLIQETGFVVNFNHALSQLLFNPENKS